ncbi:YeeE/YedE family protein [Burkholderia oklahomensis]|uniref:YeeE/YedE family protein n=1 Tax=Burkholderia oklahomensis TaxID=342113 RepID=UPI00016A6E10|nr:YeeE/YedE thiosulfate transporter family protein [Burkholderia oklahomensis]AJX35820.1 sulfur transport family protein [Burkholderia oklahomensis C6786]AOI48769.1 YeeE/YedE [Burkholderia oklahomensis C6786]KUY50626.1 YeeE/YedE [Burkholderia oklahomensis C6786]MBI0363042.1 YeeE/YedE family protein [Burkholderia oklahomensis]MDN7674444.1 YeeE/YedE thiosulfate transporter family protein [Burkholderia oklahomensis]
MAVDLVHFTPGLSLAGGLMIGAAAALLVFFDGRIAGISGIVGGLLARRRSDAGWRAAFLSGLIAAALVAHVLGWFPTPVVDAGWARVIVGGVLVGVGTRYAGGCTSGHGVCGISRGALRSIVATVVFMTAGIATVFVLRHVLGG